MNQHTACIHKLLRRFPRARTTMFREELQRAMAELDDSEAYGMVRDRVRIVPDAYIILPEVHAVICWEVRHTHQYRPGKYSAVFQILDAVAWHLSVIDVDAVTEGWHRIDIGQDTLADLKHEMRCS